MAIKSNQSNLWVPRAMSDDCVWFLQQRWLDGWMLLTLFALLSIATRNVYRSLLTAQQFPEKEKSKERYWPMKNSLFVFLHINLNLLLQADTDSDAVAIQFDRYDNVAILVREWNSGTLCIQSYNLPATQDRWLPFLLTTSHSLHAHFARWILHFRSGVGIRAFRSSSPIRCSICNLNKM